MDKVQEEEEKHEERFHGQFEKLIDHSDFQSFKSADSRSAFAIALPWLTKANF